MKVVTADPVKARDNLDRRRERIVTDALADLGVTAVAVYSRDGNVVITLAPSQIDRLKEVSKTQIG